MTVNVGPTRHYGKRASGYDKTTGLRGALDASGPPPALAGGSHVSPIAAEARERGMVVLPGAEISIGQGAGRGLHILAICDPTTRPEDINDCLRHLDAQGTSLFTGCQQHRDIELRAPLREALGEVRGRLPCVLIGAHACEKNGVVKVLGAEHAAELVRDRYLDGLDHAGDSPHKLRSTGVLTEEELRNLSLIESSDPKKLDEIGGRGRVGGGPRATWIKLSTVDAAALRLAFQRCDLPITVVLEVIQLDERQVIVVNVPKGDQRPYATGSGHYYCMSGPRGVAGRRRGRSCCVFSRRPSLSITTRCHCAVCHWPTSTSTRRRTISQ